MAVGLSCSRCSLLSSRPQKHVASCQYHQPFTFPYHLVTSYPHQCMILTFHFICTIFRSPSAMHPFGWHYTENIQRACACTLAASSSFFPMFLFINRIRYPQSPTHPRALRGSAPPDRAAANPTLIDNHMLQTDVSKIVHYMYTAISCMQHRGVVVGTSDASLIKVSNV